MGKSDKELSILLVDDQQIEKLNQTYFNRQGPTNVIAFPMHHDDGFSHVSPQLLGDVVISLETAEKEARQAEMEYDDRLYQLLIHGILHLSGYDHETTESEAKKMELKSRELFDLIAFQQEAAH